MERELKFDENSRPKGQKKVLEDCLKQVSLLLRFDF